MDWAQIISSIIGMMLVLTPPVGWIVTMVFKLDRRTTVLETKGKTDGRKLDEISNKISDLVDNVQVIKVAIAKIETVLEARSDDSNMPGRR